MHEETDIQKLLRLKRYEHPPEDYFEDFLTEFQRRQRVELMRPAWHEAMWMRASEWMDGFRVPSVAYAAILVLGIGVTGVMLTRIDSSVPGGAMVAEATDTLPAPTPSMNGLPPSYVLETRPVSYESPFSF